MKKEKEYKIPALANGPGKWSNRLVIGTPTLGTVRFEWVQSRFGQTIPTNFSLVDVHQFMSTYAPIGYQLSDAENLTAKVVVEGNFDWFCFQGKTIVETEEGSKKIIDVEVGDIVKTHTGEYQKVTKKFVNRIKEREKMIWVSTGYTVTKSTPNHPYFVERNGIREFIDAKDVVIGDLLLYPNQDNHDDAIDFDIYYNKQGNGYHGLSGGERNSEYIGEVKVGRDLARFLGLYLAEGHAFDDGIALTFNNEEIEYISFVKFILKKIFDRDSKTTNTKWQTWATQVRLSIRTLAPLFKKWFGRGAKNKKIPEFVFDFNFINRLSFIKGYLDGDGCYRKDGLIMFSSASKKLVDDMEKLMGSCGLSINKRYETQQKARILKNGQTIKGGGLLYSVTISKKTSEKFWCLLSAKKKNGYLCSKVVGVETHKWGGNIKNNNVYNLEVLGSNSYIADGAAVHNCSWEDDNVAPLDALVKINEYMIKGDTPVVSGLYFTKSSPPEPIMYRGMGQGYYADWKMGDKVWVDGVPFGFNLIHGSIIRELWKDAPEYIVNGTTTRRVFDAPSESYIDPVTGGWMNQSGTSDLAWCKKLIEEKIFEKAGWPEIQKKEFPFLVDTTIFLKHIDRNTGIQYPTKLPKEFLEGKITWKDALKILTA